MVFVERRPSIGKKSAGGQASFECPRCGKAYHHKKTLSRHIRQECGIEPEFKCPHCPYRARRAYVLNNHIRGHQYLYNATWKKNDDSLNKVDIGMVWMEDVKDPNVA
ncbi:hypothetical protein GWI33_014894 [Rhynchophorus ferrugineus]|uniref:C2H2-type domain-containing protein n=1 Tax=Rhynchophorus ferrugineus TaxID=354439 RepID=A0A834I0S3_RHYFE|nr:hypothetical protein GWI33_014894 [Rhynchophorus ferrugineus]